MVVVVGLGFAGRMAVQRLRAAGVEVVAIDARAHALERTRLHEAAARGRSVAVPLAPWLHQIGATHLQARVVEVRPGRVLLEDGREVRCDAVLLAAGSVIDDGGVPGVWEHAHHVDTEESAQRLHRELPERGRVRVVGAGLAGIELATEIAEAHPGLIVSLVGQRSGWSARGEQLLQEGLTELHIESLQARVTRVQDDGLQTDQGFLPADLVVWAGGMRAPQWLARSGLPLDEHGRVLVDATLAVPDHEGIVVAGDCAATPLRMACATAMPMGCHAADTVIRLLRGQEPRPLSFSFVARCTSMGRRRAVLQGTDPHDGATWALGGRTAAIMKETILRAAVSMHTLESSIGLPIYGWRAGTPRPPVLPERVDA
jgi:NADH dehydrogenase